MPHPYFHISYDLIVFFYYKLQLRKKALIREHVTYTRYCSAHPGINIILKGFV